MQTKLEEQSSAYVVSDDESQVLHSKKKKRKERKDRSSEKKRSKPSSRRHKPTRSPSPYQNEFGNDGESSSFDKRSVKKKNKSVSSDDYGNDSWELNDTDGYFDKRSIKKRKSIVSYDDTDSDSIKTLSSQSRNSSQSSYTSRSSTSHSHSSSRSSSHSRTESSFENGCRRVKKRSSTSGYNNSTQDCAIENANPSPLHNKSLATSSYLTPTTKRICVAMDKALIDSSTKSKTYATPVSSDDYCKETIEKHRKVIIA